MTVSLRKILPLALTAALLVMLGLLAGFADAFSAMLRDRVLLCLHTLIPSLYGCMAVAGLLRNSGAADWLGFRLRHIGRFFGMPPQIFGIFLLSQLAGYPVGAVLLRQAADADCISREDAARLSCICCGAGPAFAVGMAGTQLLGSPAAGWCLLAACFLANLIPAAVMLRSRPCTVPAQTAPPAVRIDARCITGAVSDAVRSLAAICGMVLLFGILTACAVLLRLPEHLPQTLCVLCAAAADITQLSKIYACGLPLPLLLPLAAAMLSFGGICVQWQCLALGVRQMQPAVFLCVRLISALLAAIFMRLMLPLIPLPETAAAFAHRTQISQSGSIFPALMIFLTGFPFLIKKD